MALKDSMKHGMSFILNHKIRYALYKMAKYVILALFAIIVVYLVYLAGFSTSAITPQEHTYLIGDSIIGNIGIAIAFICIVWIFSHRLFWIRRFIKKVNRDAAFSLRCRNICLLVIAAVAFAFILLVAKNPGADQLAVSNIASALMNRDYSSFYPGGYINRYPNQMGIILVLYFLGHLFGTRNYFAFQICNVAALTFLYKGFADLSDLTDHDNFEGLMIIISGILFLPGIFYTSFVYGTLIGLSCSVNGVKQIVCFEKNQKFSNFIVGLLMMLMAVVMKSNYLIFLIGAIVFLGIRLIKKWNWKLLGLLAMMFCILLGSTKAVNGVTKAVTGMDVGRGTATLSWVAMGLQDNAERYDGWYNSYNAATYGNNGYNTDAQNVESKQYIRKRINEFRTDPKMAIRFFSGKNASQWNNPDYQGIWINQVMSTNAQYPYFLYYLFSVSGSAKMLIILDGFQFILFFGVLAFIIFSDCKSDVSLFYAATLIGGFLFHTFWEAKCQYTLPYVMLMIPLSVDGYNSIMAYTDSIKGVPFGRKLRNTGILCMLIAGACIIGLSNNSVLNSVFIRNEDTKEFDQYVANHTDSRVKSGYYIVMTSIKGKQYALAEGKDDGKNPLRKELILSGSARDELYIGQSEANDNIYIRFPEDKNSLDVPNNQAAEGLAVQSYAFNGSDAQKWHLHKSKASGCVNIMFGDTWALTADTDEKRAYLSTFTDNENQQWDVTKKNDKTLRKEPI